MVVSSKVADSFISHAHRFTLDRISRSCQKDYKILELVIESVPIHRLYPAILLDRIISADLKKALQKTASRAEYKNIY
jgi:hypothetical protein